MIINSIRSLDIEMVTIDGVRTPINNTDVSIFSSNNNGGYEVNKQNENEIQLAKPNSDNRKSSNKGAKATANGKIDEDFTQGNIGDCALLSSVYALSLTDEGAEAIKDAIKINRNKYGAIISYDVHFAGADETYTITQAELKEAKEYASKDERIYSRGDDDMTIIELALEKCFTESQNPKVRSLVDNYSTSNVEDKLNGVNPAAVSYLFMGEEVDTVIKHDESLKKRFVPSSTYEIKDIYGNDISFEEGNEYRAEKRSASNIYIKDPSSEKDEYMIIPIDDFVSDIYLPDIEEASKKSNEFLNAFEQAGDDTMLVFATMKEEHVKDVNGKNVKLYGPHAYCVSEVKDGVVTLVNPHDTSKEIKVPQENLLSIDKYYLYGLDFDKEEINQ